jgi:dGTPase
MNTFKKMLGRIYEEPEDRLRNPFQRDRGRITETQAFRRLQGKTQVFVTGRGDHYRTRLTHTLEVAYISRDVARMVQLNEDLAECIALAHDLGHPPFGHAGEHALNAWMHKHGSSFEHNEQSHRIVTLLESHSSAYPGLNLNQEILDGLLKHDESRIHSLEADLVNLADEIAYFAHDCDDGLKEGILDMTHMTAIPLIKQAEHVRSERSTPLRGTMIDLLVSDLISSSNKTTIMFSSDMRDSLGQLRSFFDTNLYEHKNVRRFTREGEDIVRILCERFLENPPTKILDLQRRTGSDLIQAIKDYVSGMTDQYAKYVFKRMENVNSK